MGSRRWRASKAHARLVPCGPLVGCRAALGYSCLGARAADGGALNVRRCCCGLVWAERSAVPGSSGAAVAQGLCVATRTGAVCSTHETLSRRGRGELGSQLESRYSRRTKAGPGTHYSCARSHRATTHVTTLGTPRHTHRRRQSKESSSNVTQAAAQGPRLNSGPAQAEQAGCRHSWPLAPRAPPRRDCRPAPGASRPLAPLGS